MFGSLLNYLRYRKTVKLLILFDLIDEERISKRQPPAWPKRPRWRKVVTLIRDMTCTRSCGYSFVLLIMGAMDTGNMKSNFAVNKYLQIVASCWILLLLITTHRTMNIKCCIFMPVPPAVLHIAHCLTFHLRPSAAIRPVPSVFLCAAYLLSSHLPI